MPNDVSDTPVCPPGQFTPARHAYLTDPARPVLAHGRQLRAGMAIAAHRHPRGQLLWAMRGVLRVRGEHCVWIVPPSHAVWLPPGAKHNVVTESAAEIRNLYVDPSHPLRGGDRPAGCGSVLRLTPLLRELILRLVALDDARPFVPGPTAMTDLALAEIDALEAAPLSLPGGQDPRLTRLIRRLSLDPADDSPLAVLAQQAGSSPRTLERLFRAETGMTFRQWRGRLRVLTAMEILDRGASSTEIAYSLGYSSPSAFVAAFRKSFGQTPQSLSRQLR